MWVGDVNSLMVCIAVCLMVEAKHCGHRENIIRSDLRTDSNSNTDCNSGPKNQPSHNSKSTNVNKNQNANVVTVSTPGRPRKRCCPYDFDSSLCKIIDDRILCGFNRNVGKPKSKNKVLDLADGCRMRGGILECGYIHGPYTNPRRPPVWYNYGSQEDGDRIIQGEDTNKLSVNLTTSVPYKRLVTRCVEIRERIVCQDM